MKTQTHALMQNIARILIEKLHNILTYVLEYIGLKGFGATATLVLLHETLFMKTSHILKHPIIDRAYFTGYWGEGLATRQNYLPC